MPEKIDENKASTESESKAKSKPEKAPAETVNLTPEELRKISAGVAIKNPPPR